MGIHESVITNRIESRSSSQLTSKFAIRLPRFKRASGTQSLRVLARRSNSRSAGTRRSFAAHAHRGFPISSGKIVPRSPRHASRAPHCAVDRARGERPFLMAEKFALQLKPVGSRGNSASRKHSICAKLKIVQRREAINSLLPCPSRHRSNTGGVGWSRLVPISPQDKLQTRLFPTMSSNESSLRISDSSNSYLRAPAVVLAVGDIFSQ